MHTAQETILKRSSGKYEVDYLMSPFRLESNEINLSFVLQIRTKADDFRPVLCLKVYFKVKVFKVKVYFNRKVVYLISLGSGHHYISHEICFSDLNADGFCPKQIKKGI